MHVRSAHIKELGKAGLAPDRRTVRANDYVFTVELDLPHKPTNEKLAGYEWLNSFTDRGSDPAESGEETEPSGSESAATNSADFETEQNSSTNTEAITCTGSSIPPLTTSDVSKSVQFFTFMRRNNSWFCGLLCRVEWWSDTNVSEDRAASICRVLRNVCIQLPRKRRILSSPHENLKFRNRPLSSHPQNLLKININWRMPKQKEKIKTEEEEAPENHTRIG
jgi:hypothetical protein